MLNADHPDGYFVINLKLQDSIIEKYIKDNELYAMKSEMPIGDRFKYQGTVFRLWDDIKAWEKINLALLTKAIRMLL